MPLIHEINTGIKFLPTNQLEMLFVSPFLELTGTGVGFRLTETSLAREWRTINECIQLVKEQRIQFFALPEYSIPLQSFRQLNAELRSPEWPNNSVAIGGLEPISLAAFYEILTESDNPVETKNLIAGSSTFANLCCIWVKNNEGNVRTFIQPKQKRSREEQATQGMYEGNFALLFHTDLLSFATLVCFDCIGIKFEDLVSSMTAGVPDGSSKDLNLLFVIQHNDHPEHAEFIAFAERLLSDRPKLRTGLSGGVAFVNSANRNHGRAQEELYGRSAIYYYRRGNWSGCRDNGPLTVIPNTFALENCANTLVRTRFREDGPSAHRFSFFVPSLVGSASGATKFPIDKAVSHRLSQNGSVDQPHAVPPLKKVFFDWVCASPPTNDGRFNSSNESLAPLLAASYRSIWQKLDGISSERLEQLTNLLMLGLQRGERPAKLNPDSWQKSASGWYSNHHGQALLEFASVATALEVTRNVDVESSDHTNSGKLGKTLFTIIDGNATTDHMTMTKSYFDWLRDSSWGETVGMVNLICLTRSASLPYPNKPTEIPPAFYQPSAAEERSLPEGVVPKSENILETRSRFYWLSGIDLRSAVLVANNAAEAETQLRRLIELEG